METFAVRLCCLVGWFVVTMITCTIIGGCGAAHYAPGRVPTPQFDSVRDMYLAVGYDAASRVQMEVAVTPIQHLWITGHISYLPFIDTAKFPAEWKESDGTSLLIGQLHGEIGLGWYSGYGRKFGILAGYGSGISSYAQIGETSRFDTINTTFTFGYGNFETYFLQVSGASLKVASTAYAQLLLRGEYVRFRNFNRKGKDRPPPTALFIEPQVFTGTEIPGYPGLQMEIQVGGQFRVGGREEFLFDPIHISLAFMGLLNLL
jgi:hypothetical protein